MAFNTKRAARMREMSESALKKRVDDGTLSSAAAAYELRRRGVVYHAQATKEALDSVSRKSGRRS